MWSTLRFYSLYQKREATFAQAGKYDNAGKVAELEWDIRVAVSSSARNDVVGAGGFVLARAHEDAEETGETVSFTVGVESEQNPYSGELAAMAHALKALPDVRHRRVALLTSNQAVALTLCNPRQHSGQEYVRRIYGSINKLWKGGNGILVFWIPSSNENELL